MDIHQVNCLPNDEFVNIFENVVEKYDDCSIWLSLQRPFVDRHSLIHAAHRYLDNLNASEVEKILKLHPDLAAVTDDEPSLTVESLLEQRSAGLREISIEDSIKLRNLNQRYKSKFGFPFIICARENKIISILKGLEERLPNSKNEEIKIALEELKKITSYRIMAIVNDN